MEVQVDIIPGTTGKLPVQVRNTLFVTNSLELKGSLNVKLGQSGLKDQDPSGGDQRTWGTIPTLSSLGW